MQRIATLVALLTMAWAPAAALAQDGGASLIERGTPDMGASGAGNMARAEDAGTAHFNPAGMTRLESRELLAGVVLIFPSLKIDLDQGTRSTPPGNLDGGGNAGDPAPAAGFYMAMPIDEEQRTWFGMTLNGLYGGSVDYRDSWAGRTFVTEASFAGLNIEPSIGHRIDDNWSVGASLSGVYTVLDVEFKAAAPAGAPDLEIDEADDWGIGWSLAAMYEHDERTRIGARYRSKVDMDLDGSFRPPGAKIDFDADLEMPQSAAVGAFHEVSDDWALLGDVSWTEWSAFGYQPATIATNSVPIDRDWDDVWRIGAGVQHQATEKTTWRFGVAWTEDPVSSSRRLPDIPVGEQWRFSTGFEFALSENTDLGLSYTYVWMKDMDLNDVALPPNFRTSLRGEFEDAHIHVLGVTFRYRF
jgi:long-chain fatty acid transport protein